MEAMFYESLPDNKVQCNLCSHRCIIGDGKRGICGVRENQNGTLYTLVYGKVIAEHVDGIEKKPLFHFLPGSTAYSIGTVGCNFRCKYCQNFDISQYPRDHGGEIVGHERTPEQIVASAKEAGCESIAHTYTEPTIFYELAYETAVLARKEGLKNVFVSNGYMSPESACHISAYLDAINIDVKSFDERTYKEICGARLKPVLQTVELMKELGIWVEATTLIIPGVNDDDGELRNIARFLKEIDFNIPWHVTRFYPTYKLMDPPPTPVETLRRARSIGLEEGLHYVYEGNVPAEGEENTYCHACGALLIHRRGMGILENRIKDGSCPECGLKVEGVDL